MESPGSFMGNRCGYTSLLGSVEKYGGSKTQNRKPSG